jgi:hypothetical protein
LAKGGASGQSLAWPIGVAVGATHRDCRDARGGVTIAWYYSRIGVALTTLKREDRVAGLCRVYYHGRKMTLRKPGKTVKVSISLDSDDLAVLKRRARESYRGNLSAAFSEAARLILQREARTRLVGILGGPTLTPSAAGAIEAEQAGRHGESKKPRRARAA